MSSRCTTNISASSSLPMVGRKLTSHFGEFPKLKGGFEGRTMTKQPKTRPIAYHKTEKRSALCSMVSPPPSVGDQAEGSNSDEGEGGRLGNRKRENDSHVAAATLVSHPIQG